MPKRHCPVLLSFVVATVWSITALAAQTESAFDKAARLYEQQKWQAAAAAFAKCAGDHSRPAQQVAARFYLGECLMQLGDYAAARENFLIVLDHETNSPRSRQALFRSGEASWLNGDVGGATDSLEQFVQKFPHDNSTAYAYTYLGDIAAEAGNYDQAISLYRKVIDHYAHSPRALAARLGLARTLLAIGRGSEVALALGQLTKSDDPSTAADALMLLGRSLYDRANYGEALITFRQLCRDFPENTHKARARLAAGWSLWKQSNFDEVPDEVERLADDARWTVDHRYLLGMTAYAQRKWPSAIDHLRLAFDAAANHPGRDAVLFYLAESYFHGGKHDAARHAYRQLTDDHPNSNWADDALWGLARLARVDRNNEDFQIAVSDLKRRFPNSDYLPRLHTANATSGRLTSTTADEQLLDEAVGLERDGRHDAALSAYHELLQKRPDGPAHVEALRRIARLHHGLAQYSEAARAYRRFLSLYPESSHAASSTLALAWLELQRGNRQAAAAGFRCVHAKFPQSAQAPEAAYWLALAAADEEESASALCYVDWLLDELAGTTESDTREIWEQTVCLKCQLSAASGHWQEIKELLDEESEKLQEGPTRAQAGFWLAESRFRMNDFEAARTAFNHVRSQIAGLDEPWVAMVPLRRAQLKARRQQWSDVLEILSSFDRKYPNFQLQYEVEYIRGRAYAGRGEMTAARRAYLVVLEDDNAKNTETAAMAQWMIGETYFHQRNYARAREAYSRVNDHATQPGWQARAALQAGKCWELEDHWEEATSLYANALERWQGSDSEEQLRARWKWAAGQLTQRK